MPIAAKTFLVASNSLFFFLWHAAKTYFLEDAKETKNVTFFIIFCLTVLGKIQDSI
jgi:hypothetical protein